ncbi:MAG: DNA repair exonuclease [Gammaproteobacteria bacterium]|nr:MAG: DNA repair exonuclease [Gammaproteobacteria bacterium]
MTRFVHTADWQIGKPYGSVAEPGKRALLQEARIQAIERLGEVAAEADAAFIVVAGDLFDSATVPSATVSKTLAAIGALARPVYVIPGNHDHGGAGGIWGQAYFQREHDALAPNLHVLLEAEPVVLDTAVLLPCPLLRRHASDDPAAWLARLEGQWEGFGDLPRIVLAHGSVQDFTGAVSDEEEDLYTSVPNRLHLERMPMADIDYIALGDWHGTLQVGPKAWYAGAHEQDRFPRGPEYTSGQCLVVTAERGAPPGVRAAVTGAVRWHQLSHEFVGEDPVSAFKQAMAQLLGGRVERDLLELRLSGALGFADHDRLQDELSVWTNRLIRLKLKDTTTYAPTAEEIDALANRAEDPLIAQVAQALLAEGAGEGREADVARHALRELHRLAG